MIRYIILAGLLLTGMLVKSQAPVADFTSSVTSGCAPLTVDYKDASANNPKFWNWDLGNGVLANTQNTSVTYYNPGKYTIQLVVRNADGTNGITRTDYIVVNPSPTAEFTVDRNIVCMPSAVNFTDKSVANAGVISKYEWDFGDGSFSNASNPSKVYATPAYYSISLKVTSSTGCTASNSKGRFVRVLAGITTAFKDPVTTVCTPPYDLKFLNETSGPGTLTYNWDFGNGNTSTIKDPAFTVTTTTPLNVQLITVSDLGCSDTLKKTIAVNSSLTTFTGPDSACLNTPVAFQNTSPSSTASQWSFSDGNSSSQLSTVTRTFTTAGSYSVKLVNTYPACIDSLTKTIKVLPPPTVDFTSNIPGACKAPQSITFQDISPGAISWLWDFGDGGTATSSAPAHTYAKEGAYDVKLTITTKAGCTNTITKSKFIRIAPPTVQFANAPTGGCIPFVFSPTANINAIDGVNSYLWDFGDAGVTSTLPNPSHSYNTAGNFTIKLAITTNGGCTGTVTLTDGVKTGVTSVPDFTANTVQSCADSVIQFNNLSTPPAGLTYTWEFGDGKTSTQVNPTHQYDSSGSYSVKLTTSNNGCLSSLTKPSYITVQPPVARFTYKSNCSTLPTVTFTNTSVIDNTKPIAYLWNFGDAANGTSTSPNPVHQFPSKQTYNVRLTVTNGSCVNTYLLPVLLGTEKADFSKSTSDTICKLQNVMLTAINSNPQNISKYQWAFDGNPFFDWGNNIFTNFNHTGKIPMSLAVTDLGGCSDTITKFITIIGSKSDFTPSDTAICANRTITFNDKSSPAGSITKWTFDFGDGTKQSYTTTPFTHQYTIAGSYPVSLIITGKDGCTDSTGFNNLVRISKPQAAFATNDTLICPGGSLIFTNFSSIIKPASYLWNFGDGSATSNLQNPNHTYAGVDSAYTVSLKIVDSLGCSDSLSRIKYIKLASPKSAFTISDSATICPPLNVEFRPNIKNYKSFYWDFGDNTTSTLDTPNHFYNNYGSYIAKLYVVGAGGCTDSSMRTININNPYNSTITYSPTSACNSLLVNFVVKKPANSFYVFYFGDGSSNTTQKDSLQHLYTLPNTYSPFMALGDSSGCQVGINGATPIKILGAEPLFSSDKKSFCDSGTVFFTNYTLTNDPITSSVWDFGDGNTSTDKDPIHTFGQPGRYVVSLNVTTQSGCSKSITDTIKVYKTPVPSIGSDSVACINAPLLLKGLLSVPDSTASYNWNLGSGTSSSLVNPSVTYTTAGTYLVTLEVTNALGCKGTISKNITVAPLPVVTVAPNIVVPVGAGITIPITYSPRVKTYSWTPIAGLSCINCATPIAYPKITTNYTVNVTDSNGCIGAGTVTLTVVCNDKNYFVPNTFSPNGDGNNDVFFPRGNNINRVQSMRIFSRWGEMIFEKKNFAANSATDGWPGTYKGKPAPADVYVYIVEFVCENGSIIPFRGNVTLIR